MPTDLKLNPLTHDIDLTSGTATMFEDNISVVAQRVKIAILTKRGEWFRNIREGIPYYQDFFSRKNNKSFIDQFMVNYIADIEDVSKVTSYESTIDVQSRNIEIKVSVETYDGTILNINVGGL